MEKKRWYIDAALILIVLILGVLVVMRLTNNAQSQSEEVQPAESTSQEDVSGVETEVGDNAAVDSTAEPEVLSVEGDQDGVEVAPDFTLTDLEGNSVSLSDYSGTPVLVNFWATWCPPCRSELPLIQRYQDKYGDEFVVLAVDGGETAEDVQSFVDAQGYTMKFLLDPDFAVAELYQVRGFPTSLFIDANGAIQKVHIGELTEPMIIAYLEMIGIAE